MCKYCENLFKGNASKNLNQGEIAINGVFAGTMITFVGEERCGQTCLNTVLLANNGHIIAEDRVKIEWCPVCGRELKMG